jgi:hypothetical protein
LGIERYYVSRSTLLYSALHCTALTALLYPASVDCYSSYNKYTVYISERAELQSKEMQCGYLHRNNSFRIECMKDPGLLIPEEKKDEDSRKK